MWQAVLVCACLVAAPAAALPIETLEGLVAQFDAKIAARDQELTAQFDAKIAARDSKIAHLEAETVDLKAELNDLMKRLKSSRAVNGLFSTAAFVTKAHLDVCPADCEAKIDRLKITVGHNLDRVTTLNAVTSQLKTWLSGNVTAIASANAAIAKNAAAIASQGKSINIVRQESKNQDPKISANTASITALGNRITALDNSKVGWEADVQIRGAGLTGYDILGMSGAWPGAPPLPPGQSTYGSEVKRVHWNAQDNGKSCNTQYCPHTRFRFRKCSSVQPHGHSSSDQNSCNS